MKVKWLWIKDFQVIAIYHNVQDIWDIYGKLQFFIVCRMECSENEKKAQEEYDKIYEGMKEVNDKMKVITDAKKEKETACKKIVKYVF